MCYMPYLTAEEHLLASRMRVTFRQVLLLFIALVHAGFVWLRLVLKGVAYYRVLRIHALAMSETVMVLFSMYIYNRLSIAIKEMIPSENDRPLPMRTRWRRICMHDVAWGMVIVFLLLSHCSFVFYYVFLGTEPNMLAVISLSCVAAYLHVGIFLLVADFCYFASKLISKYVSENGWFSYMEKNRSVHITLAFVCGLMFILGGLYSTSQDPVITSDNVPMRKFSGSEDVRLVLLSDIHIGPSVGLSRMKKIVEQVNNINPDIVAIAGDLADGLVRDFGEAAAPLCDLKAPGGVYFATGNHEYMHGNVEEWFDYLGKCNISVLHNSNIKKTINGQKLCIAGVDDLFAARAHFPGHAMNIPKALDGCLDNESVILLAHQPNAARSALTDPKTQGKTDLILSGHTHGGQMYLLIPIVYIANAFTRGLYYYAPSQTWVYVSAGVNFFGPPIKMFNSCEIINLLLTGPSIEL